MKKSSDESVNVEIGKELIKNSEDENTRGRIEETLNLPIDHFERYRIQFVDSESAHLVQEIHGYKQIFDEYLFKTAMDDYFDQACDLYEGRGDENIILLLKSINFDYNKIIDSDLEEHEKVAKLVKVIVKAKSYEEAVDHNRGKEIEFDGFENDSDIFDIKEFLYNTFGRKLLEECLVSKIKYFSDKILLKIGKNTYIVPIDIYERSRKYIPNIKENKYKGAAFSSWNSNHEFSQKYVLTPINLFSFYDETPEEIDYLEKIPNDKKMRMFKLGIINHEIAHHIYDYLIDCDKCEEWEKIVEKQKKPLTQYSDRYSNHELKYDEYFAEAVRIMTTSPGYLGINFPEIDRFIKVNFPEIQEAR